MKNVLKISLAALLALGILGAMLLLPVLLLGGAVMGVREDKEVYRVEAPDGRCYAVVIESDQGALGGATYVDVVEKPRKLLFFEISGKTRRIYTGGWSEARDIQVIWQDADTLLINGQAYPAGL